MKTFELVIQKTKLVEVWLCRDKNENGMISAWPVAQGDNLIIDFCGIWMDDDFDRREEDFKWVDIVGEQIEVPPELFCKTYGCKMKDLPRKGRKIRARIRVIKG